MGNANGREEGGGGDTSGRSNGPSGVHDNYALNSDGVAGRVASSDSMAHTPPESPGRTQSPLLFTPQAPIAPMQRGDGNPIFNQMWQNESDEVIDHPLEQGIPTMITWNFGGNDVAVEGSWDNWTMRKKLQRCGKDHSILFVLPSGIYQYKFFVDGEWRYIPDLPCIADEKGHICNLLDVNDYVPENPQSITEFEAPASPDSSYSQAFPPEEDFAKEPLLVPPQLHLTVLDVKKTSEEPSSLKPQHVVLNHLFIEKSWASQSLVTLGVTHRFESKYVTVVLYKPLKR